MSEETKQGEPTLDEIIAEVRRESVDEPTVEQAAQRVWARLAEQYPSPATATGRNVEKIRDCGDFQALVPAYLAGTVSAARSLLLEDHVHGCVACRHALEAARAEFRGVAGVPPGVARTPALGVRGFFSALWTSRGAQNRGSALPLSPRSFSALWTSRGAQSLLAADRGSALPLLPRRPRYGLVAWAFAAGVCLMGLGLLLGGGRLVKVLRGTETEAVVQAVHGALYQVSDRGSVALLSGGAIIDGEEIRTAKASSAVIRLVDGSAIEMNQRTGLWVSKGWRDTTLHLQRGNIIVRAARQLHGRLHVATPDCLVSVKGTIFAVDEGMKGSRVSVIQGEVEVEQGRRIQFLHSGEQFSTEASLTPVPVTNAVTWSRDSGEYLALLSEFAALHKQLQAIPGPAPRYDSTLLKLVPDDTVFYAAIPNMGSTLSEANRLLQERIQQSEVLQAWWSRQQASGEARKQAEMIDRIRNFSDYLGEEIVVAAPAEGHTPLILAETRRPDFREFLETQISQMRGEAKEPKAVIVDDPFSFRVPATEKGTALVYLKNNLLAVATEARPLQKVATLVEHSTSSNFASTPFYAAIHQAYQAGAGFLLCADMEQIVALSVSQKGGQGRDLLRDERTGLADMRYLVMESKNINGRTENRATLTFTRERRGVAAWLAPPSPMGTLDFVSPAAGFALSFVVENPREIVQQIISLAGSSDSQFEQELADFESETGVNVSEDLAGALGGEATFALDGPVLPTPSWKVAVEVNDPTRLEGAIEKLVASYNQHAEAKSGTLNLTEEDAGGRTYYTLQASRPAPAPGLPKEVDYVFVDGYLLAASDRVLLLSSMQNRSTGYTLARSTDFTSRLPRDGFTNCSALVYQNLGGMLGSGADLLTSTSSLTPAQRQAIDALRQNSTPSLTCAYGEPEDIVVANTGNLFGLGFDSLLGINGVGAFQALQAIQGASNAAPTEGKP
jgi:hypothetical protein